MVFREFYKGLSLGFFRCVWIYLSVCVVAIRLNLKPKELRGVYIALQVMVNKKQI